MLLKIVLVCIIVSATVQGVPYEKDESRSSEPEMPEDLNFPARSLQSLRETITVLASKLNLLQIFTPAEEKTTQFWKSESNLQLVKNLEKRHLNENQAKNIIFFVADGMSSSTATAARLLKGQKKNETGDRESLSFENFPFTGLSKAYCANSKVADSACSATAYSCGVKSNILTVGVNANVRINNCTESRDAKNQVSSIAQWAQKAGKSTGFITTTTVTDASPSGMFAHTSNRMFQSDADVQAFGGDPAVCVDIAKQLITEEPGRNFNVIMGGGRSKFLPNTTSDVYGNMGARLDGEDLFATWSENHPNGIIVNNRNELKNLDTSKYSDIVGIFHTGHMDFHLNADPEKQPTLSEMTEVALKLLQQNNKGFFVFIEGGLIDKAHHATKAALALDETLEFEKAIELARKMTNPKDTLIVVTSDHSHPLTILGYPYRRDDILGVNKFLTGGDGLKYSTLSYPMGPEQYVHENGTRKDLTQQNFTSNSPYPSYIKAAKGHHAGDDVNIYASGPFDYLFSGLMDQTVLPRLMSYAGCIGEGPTMCDSRFLYSLKHKLRKIYGYFS